MSICQTENGRAEKETVICFNDHYRTPRTVLCFVLNSMLDKFTSLRNYLNDDSVTLTTCSSFFILSHYRHFFLWLQDDNLNINNFMYGVYQGIYILYIFVPCKVDWYLRDDVNATQNITIFFSFIYT